MIANLIASQYGSISDIEILWTLIALFGLGFSVYSVREAAADSGALRRSGEKNGRLILARTTLRSEVARMIIQLIFLMIGLAAMTIQEPPAQIERPLNIVLASFLIQWGLILSSLIVSLKSFWAYQARAQLKLHYGDPQDPNSRDRDINMPSFEEERDERDSRQDERDVRQEERDERQASRERTS